MMNDNLMLNVSSEDNFNISFKDIFASNFLQSEADKVALLVTNEYEGIFADSVTGTYYKNLSQKLSQDGWYVILLICRSQDKFEGKSSIPHVKHLFSICELEQVLSLQPIHSAMLSQLQYKDVVDYTSYCCLFFTQAVIATFKSSFIYVEFHEYGGIGYRTIQAKRANILEANCLTAVTMHGGHEWISETNERYIENDPDVFWQICYYEQYAFENADLAFFTSYYLKSKVESYGWKTSHALHLPYFIPIVEKLEFQENLQIKAINIVFLGSLEEKNGLPVFLEAIKLLNSTLKNQIHIYFLGKIVTLQSSKLQHLNSQEYIQQELENNISFSIFPEFNSQEVIQLVNQLDYPIVCLTSSQDKFPHRAWEMAQLTVNLIVSDTSEFREILEFINRSEETYWFKPKDSKSLFRVINKVIDTYTANIVKPEILKKSSLFQINEQLKVRKIEYIEELVVKSSPETDTLPKVTIGVTCYNLGKYLLNCLNSLNVQTYKNLEVIVLDDASPDEDTQEVINQAQVMFPNFKFIKSNINIGLGAARNYLVEIAEGDYFIPFDADNIALPFMVEKYVKAAFGSNAAIVNSPMMAFGSHTIGVKRDTSIYSFTGGLLPAMLQDNCWGDAASLFSINILRKFKHPEDRGVVCHDWQIMVATSVTNEKMGYYTYPLYFYRLRPDSMIHSNKNHARDRYHLRRYLSQIEPSNYSHRHLYMLLTATQQLLQSQQHWQSQLQQAQVELERAKVKIAAMETSNTDSP